MTSLHLYVEAVGHPFAIRMYAGELKLEKTTTPGKKPYLLLNLPYCLGAYLHAYVAWLVQQKL
ncbi:hypothetical protein [Sphingobacterium pedocola]|uniref:Uncharacterized protein n=1 Tax=Sphingobacterium pedocola TaxID=2082722 RepID=A0ABR9T9B0_9SPHI|nr:hypothetical protein [Sphingobacterium pedocola]MBE8721926.1 hypothetical protein [Sphingobacterium pedocola]